MASGASRFESFEKTLNPNLPGKKLQKIDLGASIESSCTTVTTATQGGRGAMDMELEEEVARLQRQMEQSQYRFLRKSIAHNALGIADSGGSRRGSHYDGMVCLGIFSYLFRQIVEMPKVGYLRGWICFSKSLLSS